MRAIGYARVSTGEQGLGLEAQSATIRAACTARGWSLERVYSETLSGASRKRPELERAMDDATGGALVVAKLDRLTRSLVHLCGLMERAERDEIALVALDLGLDMTSDVGRLTARIMGAIAEWERERIGERTRDALAAKRASGWRPGRPVVLSQHVSDRILELRSVGATLAGIARRLNEDEVPTAHGGKRWYPSTVKSVLDRSGR